MSSKNVMTAVGRSDGGHRSARRGRGRAGAGRAAGRRGPGRHRRGAGCPRRPAWPPPAEPPPPQREIVAALIQMCLRQAQDLVDDPGGRLIWDVSASGHPHGWGRGSATVPACWPPRRSSPRSGPSWTSARCWLLRSPRPACGPGGGPSPASTSGAGPGDGGREHQGGRARGPGHGPARGRDQHRRGRDLRLRRGSRCSSSASRCSTNGAASRALRPGGRPVLGRDGLVATWWPRWLSALRTIRGGGADFTAARLVSALEAAGCADAGALPRSGPAPMDSIAASAPGNVAEIRILVERQWLLW